MRKKLLNSISVLALLFIQLTNSHCKKETTDKFCEVQRTDYWAVNNKEGMIVFSNKYNRYGVSLILAISNNINSQVIGLVCGLSPELKTIGLKVVVSGTLKYFNSDENMTWEIAGQDIYSFETSQLIKRPQQYEKVLFCSNCVDNHAIVFLQIKYIDVLLI